MPRDRAADSAVMEPVPSALLRERVIVVASGKRGVGTSVAASLLALVCATEGARVLLVDGNEKHGALHLLFGVRPTQATDVLDDASRRDNDLLVPITDRLSLAASWSANEHQPSIDDEPRGARLARLLQPSDEHDYVIVDAGSRLDTVLAATAAGAGTALIVSDANRISLASNYALIKVLSQRAPAVRCSVLVNRHDEPIARAATGQLSEACQRFLDKDLPSAGWLPNDASLSAAVGAGMPIADAAEDSPATTAMLAIAERILPSLAAVKSRAAGSGTHPAASWS
ncbi:MinD/ParA family protein [soil metagenome]